MNKAELLWSYDAEFPGFVEYFDRLLRGYFHLSPRTHPEVASRMGEALEALEPEVARRALGDFQAQGLFSGEPLSNDAQVKLFWTSPLMSVYRAAMAYAPRPTDDVLAAVPEPVASATELVTRQAAYSSSDMSGDAARGYWNKVLLTAAPELYLWPFLTTRQGLLRGLDLGCGWGRATLGLRHFERVEMVGVDLNAEELELFEQLSERAGLAEQITTMVADITALPLPGDHFDFAISYVVLDLLSDASLETALREVLRCLRPDSPFYVDIPTDRYCGEMMLQRQDRRGFIELLHGLECENKIFQLVFHEVAIPMQYTFGVFDRRDFEAPLGRRPASLAREASARLTGEAPQKTDWRRQLQRRRKRGPGP